VEEKSSAYYGSGSGDILLSNVDCNGKEASIQTCSASRYPGGCSHYEDVGISCSNGNSFSYVGSVSNANICYMYIYKYAQCVIGFIIIIFSAIDFTHFFQKQK
jgi:deleted-in-malignant-brain-tumors protein 1